MRDHPKGIMNEPETDRTDKQTKRITTLLCLSLRTFAA